jgi:dimethylargininase
VDLDKAQRQHEQYSAALKANPACAQLICLPCTEQYPDSVFVEDAAVALPGGQLLLTAPGAPSRRGEVDQMAHDLPQALRARIARRVGHPGAYTPTVRPSTREAAAATVPISSVNGAPRLEGGDIMRVGGVTFVGLSTRTNRAGADAMMEALNMAAPGHVVAAVPVPQRTLHLKSVVSWGGAEAGFFIVDSAEGRHTWDALRGSHRAALASHAHAGGVAAPEARALDWRVTWVPDALGANVLRLGRAVYWNSAASVETQRLFERLATEQQAHLDYIPLDMGELAKVDGALTCCSVFMEATGWGEDDGRQEVRGATCVRA